MSILSGFFKTKKYRKTTDGYKLESNWTSGNTVELDDGNTVQNNLGAIKGITTSTSVTEQGYAADATTVAALNESLDAVRSHVGMIIQSTTLDTEAKVKAIYGGTSWSLIQGRMLLGASASHAVNTTGGSETNTLEVANLPSHSHGLNNHTHSIPTLSGSTGGGGSHSHSGSNNHLDYAQPGGTQNNRYMICAGGGIVTNFEVTNTVANHTHTVTTNASTTGGNTGNTANTGSGTAFNNLPPYKAVYIWERTA